MLLVSIFFFSFISICLSACRVYCILCSVLVFCLCGDLVCRWFEQ